MRLEKDDKEIMRQFRVRQNKQLLAVSVTLLLLLFFILLFKRNDLFGEFSKNFIVSAQIFTIVAFITFSYFNWRCPFCNKYLGADFYRRMCKRCRTRLS